MHRVSDFDNGNSGTHHSIQHHRHRHRHRSVDSCDTHAHVAFYPQVYVEYRNTHHMDGYDVLANADPIQAAMHMMLVCNKDI